MYNFVCVVRAHDHHITVRRPETILVSTHSHKIRNSYIHLCSESSENACVRAYSRIFKNKLNAIVIYYEAALDWLAFRDTEASL